MSKTPKKIKSLRDLTPDDKNANRGTEKKLLSISELARRKNLDRATVRQRLEQERITPKQEGAKSKLYDADEALEALKADDRTGLRKAQTIKTAVEASRVQLKLAKERGEVVEIKKVRADLQELVKRIFQHFAVTGPRELAPQLRGLTTAQITEKLKRDAEQFFNDLRAEHESYL